MRSVGERDEGMRAEYERACIIAQQCLAEHQNMSDIRRGLSIDNTQQPRTQPVDNAAAAPNAPGRLYKANGEFKPDTLTKDSSAGQYEFWKRQFRRYYTTSKMDLDPFFVKAPSFEAREAHRY